MRRTWNERAAQDAEYYVFTGVQSGEDFEASGRENYEQIIRPLLPVLLRGRPPQQCRVVEIGCGLGRITACLAQEFGEVHGVDVAPEMIAKARERLRRYSNVFLHLGSGMDLDCLPGGYFDLAFSYLVFQHVPSRDVIRNYIREAARVLKSGGAFHFQINGYQAAEYRQGEKDTWLGESFSFPEAVEMLREAGFSPFNSVGAGTQYFILSARRTTDQTRELSSFILPGQAWPQGQFLEGWSHPIPGDCRPVGAVNRALLGFPAGNQLRLFLALDCGPAGTPPSFTLTLEGQVFRSAPISGPGAHYWEFPIPPGLCASSRAMVTLRFEPASGNLPVSVRSLGIYALDTEAEGEDIDAPGATQSTATRELENSERIFWIANVEQECARLAKATADLQADMAAKMTWASSLQGDLESKVVWARSLETDVEKARGDLAQLRAEFEERTTWALSLQEDVEAARSAWAHTQNELSECQAQVQQLEGRLRFAHEHPWRLVAKQLRAKWKAVIGGSQPPP